MGDVVVSQPEKGRGGVLQYDFGKTTSGKIEQTGFLNTPPRILLSAVAKVRAQARTMENLEPLVTAVG